MALIKIGALVTTILAFGIFTRLVAPVFALDSVTRGLLCIKHYESDGSGGWRAVSSDGTYHGGLQMDFSFERTYGARFVRRWGHAENWPAWAQLRAATVAVADRGWSPWPNTRRYCRL